MAYKKAIRESLPIKMALYGPSFSGKTFSALRLATGLSPAGKIALLDTERRSSLSAADKFDFDVDYLETEFSPKSYQKKIHEAESAGFEVLIIDSLTHAWEGTGGVLEIKDKADQESHNPNKMAGWMKATPEHNDLINAILQSPIHVICTMRAKTMYEITEGVNAKGAKIMKPQKIGLRPAQREGMDYEFFIVFSMQVNKCLACVEKDRTEIFFPVGKLFQPTEEDGKKILQWCNSGVVPIQRKHEPAPPIPAPKAAPAPAVKTSPIATLADCIGDQVKTALPKEDHFKNKKEYTTALSDCIAESYTDGATAENLAHIEANPAYFVKKFCAWWINQSKGKPADDEQDNETKKEN